MNSKQIYEKKTHFYGRLWMTIALVVLFLIPLSISILTDSWPSAGDFFKGYLPILALFGPVSVIEIATYGPMLGTAGTYLGFITGNLANLKVPAALNAMNNAHVEPGSDEAEVISTIAIAVCSIATIIILFVGVIGFSQIMPILNSDTLAPAFANLLPALFGGFGVVFISRNPRIAAAPLIFSIVLFLIYPAASSAVSILIPINAIIAIIVTRKIYKKELNEEKALFDKRNEEEK